MPSPDFTRADLKAAIPADCFQSSTARSFSYLVFDLVVIGLLYWALASTSVWFLEAGLIFLIGAMFWAVFGLGHEAGHGAFSPHRWVNTLVGLFAHSIILVPYRGWQRSHGLHHMKTGHLREEEVFRACRAEEDRLFRKLLFRSGMFVLIGWPLYKIGFRNLTTYDPIKGSHYLPASDLYAPHVRWSWLASLAGVLVCLGAYLTVGFVLGWDVFLKFILAPYLAYGAWLTFVTYMHHVSPEVPVYDSEDWDGLKGALCTVDRNYAPFNWLTHHIGDCHVIHHVFPTIPHYHAKRATEAVRPILGDWYLSSDQFVLFDFVRTLIGCHFVEHEDGREVYKSAYGFAPNFGGQRSATLAAPGQQ